MKYNMVILSYHPSALTNWVVKLAPYMKWSQLSVLHIAKLHGVEAISIEGIKLYDVSNYSFKQAEKLVKELNPDLFVFLSFRSVLELTYHRICTTNHIHKVYLEHGLFSNDTLKFRTNKLKKEFRKTFYRQFSFAKTQIGYIINSGNVWNESKLYMEVFFYKKFKIVPYDHYFLFSRRSFDNYSKLFPMEEGKNVTYIGYPIFSDEEQKKIANVHDGGGILYVHQPLISDGLAKITYDEEKQWLLKISSILAPQYGTMTILLHPRANLEDYKKRYEGTGIEVTKAPNNFRLFADKSLIVGHYSTALLYGLYFEKPTVVLDYPTMNNDSLFSEIFTFVDDLEKLPICNFKVNSEMKEYMVGNYNTFEHIAHCLNNYVLSFQ